METHLTRRNFLQTLAAVCAAEALPAFASRHPHVAHARPLSFFEHVQRLKPRQFLWAPQIAPEGEMVVIVSIPLQRAYVYRNGVPIAVSTVSTGKKSNPTYTGIYRTLEKQRFHRSNAYSDAPMPWMQRLTSWGVAMHAGHLPGYPASHGCVRLPPVFAKLLFEAAPLGTTVVITDTDEIPRIAPTAERIWADANALKMQLPLHGAAVWNVAGPIDGPLSLVLTQADSRLLVIHNAAVIGSVPVQMSVPVAATSAYVLRQSPDEGTCWSALAAAGCTPAKQSMLPVNSLQQYGVQGSLLASLSSMLTEGTTLVLTRDSMQTRAEGGNFAYVAERDPGQSSPARNQVTS